ncbi:glycoside hydrolase family 97 protein [Brevundimonas sp. Root1279]|uniref:glycoside hydrolase family 97 protein n=1 Tax=Brevundimonas sp. Root1279 TaxID=1736443 RepID=UPI000A5BF02A|nr:glycoside hydrolase family 97 protein [Brevundimonas sp. Root1279]
MILTRRFLISTTALMAALPASALAQPLAQDVAQAPAGAVGQASASSPGGVLTVQVGVTGEGRPEYTVSRMGRPVIEASRLGFILTDATKLERNFTVTADAPTSHDEPWEQPWGEKRHMQNRYTEWRTHFVERAPLSRRFDVVFRIYDDGVGFRYEFPEQANLKTLNVSEELTEFAVADAGEAWWVPAFEWNREEYLYNRTRIDEVGVAQTPITLRTDGGLHVSLHEAALVDYSGMNLRRVGGGRFKAALTPGLTNAVVTRDLPFHTPWRTLQITDTAGELVTSGLILNLNEPNKLGDVSWFKPMKYVGIWWDMHLDRKTWASGPKHGATTDYTLKHIDFAAQHGFGGVLVEGWNKGWDGEWFGNGWDYSFTEPYADWDIQRIADYARSKGVEIIGHHETGGNAFHYEQQMDAGFALYQRMGWHSVKTGYVADAGGARVRGLDGQATMAWHESQPMVQHHQRVIESAARHQVAVNAHEPLKDTGLRRTYPNIISREGQRGMEYNAWGNPGNPPEHEVNLVFTRMLAGPMDFTPGIFGMNTRAPDGVATTWAKQLALYVTLYSPIQMAADILENYEANPGPFQFIKDVVTDWEDTRVLNGEVGDFVTIARKDRNSDQWFLGAITDEEPRNLPASLSFLEPGRRYRAEIYRDAPGAHWKTNREAIDIVTQEVTAADTLTLRLAPGGGQAIRFVPLGRGRR